jgi:hypothetical protein
MGWGLELMVQVFHWNQQQHESNDIGGTICPAKEAQEAGDDCWWYSCSCIHTVAVQQVPLMAISLGLLAWWAREIRAYMKRNKEYQERFPVWKTFNDRGYLCNQCGSSFILAETIIR